jgi:hypothetical protein
VRFVDACQSEDDDRALALILLNAEADPYPMMVWLEKARGEWTSLQATEIVPAAWSEPGDIANDRVSWAIGAAPVDATSVRLRAGSASLTRDVKDGWYVIAVWHSAPAAPGSIEFGRGAGRQSDAERER